MPTALEPLRSTPNACRLRLLATSVIGVGGLAVVGCAATDSDADANEPRAAFHLAHAATLGYTGPGDTTLLIPVDFRIHGSRFVIADRAGPSVRVVDSDGVLERVIGGPGQGPGEFGQLRGVAVSPAGLIAVSDDQNRRIAVFHHDGIVEREIRIVDGRLGAIAHDDRGRLHVDRRGAVGDRREPGAPTITVLSADGETLGTYGDYRPGTEPFADAMLNEVRFAPASDGALWLLWPFRGALELRDENGRLIRRFDVPPPLGRPADGPFTAPVPEIPGAVAVVRMPVADDVAVDETGRIFVAVYQTPEHRRPYSEILVYDGAGRLGGVGRLERPARRIAVRGGRLFALLDGSSGFTGIDAYDVITGEP